MNPAALRTALRQGGWVGVARSLPSEVARRGLPLDRRDKLGLVRIMRDPAQPDQLVAQLRDQLIATEEGPVVYRDEVQPIPNPSRPVSHWLTQSTIRKLERYARDHHLSRSAALARILETFLWKY
jgi:hypothetical protein